MRARARIVVLAVASLAGCDGEFATAERQIRDAEAAYQPQRLRDALAEIEAWHVKHGTGAAASLREGLAASAVEALFDGEACMPGEELKRLWAWRDGGSGTTPFVWYHDFLPAEAARREYQMLLWNPLVRWDPRYVPVFSFEGEWYATYCGPGGRVAGPVVHLFLEDEPRIVYASLTTYLATIADAMRSGAVSWVNGAMVEDIGQLFEIHRRHNPGYPFPYHVEARGAEGR